MAPNTSEDYFVEYIFNLISAEVKFLLILCQKRQRFFFVSAFNLLQQNKVSRWISHQIDCCNAQCWTYVAH